MKYIADLHTHSKYAGACSDKLTLENMASSASQKGISILGTGDFTHPLWFNEIKSKLHSKGNGVYHLERQEVNFILTTEVSIIFSTGSGNPSLFSRDANNKKIHNCIMAPNIEVAEQINERLSKFGDLKLDGRPVLTISAAHLVELMHGIDKDIIVYPAHIWTPWFGAFGSLSGFDSMKDAYEDQEMHIHALETGLSSDPSMNWRVSSLDKYSLLSGSDAHSLEKLGREVTIFDMKNVSYFDIQNLIKNKNVDSTIEFYPEEGKYHYDGHRRCNISISPEDAKKYNNICPVCRKKLTIGVLHRVEDLADREPGYKPKNVSPYIHAIPLREIIAEANSKGINTLSVKTKYDELINNLGTELFILTDCKIEKIMQIDENVGNAIRNVRNGEVNISPGYDGVFGVIDVMNKNPIKKKGMQRTMRDF
ncbi:MAG: endonuclease Q family protein [Candidatus Marsarchaeota archaeon]|nr:endonuclease Q family protein [Candidatus Marsarchaeota archaeon]